MGEAGQIILVGNLDYWKHLLSVSTILTFFISKSSFTADINIAQKMKSGILYYVINISAKTFRQFQRLFPLFLS